MKKSFETFGNYILLEKLAAGGMAEVYLAKKIAASGVQKFVAVKRILQQFSDSQDFIDMFKDEAKIAINLAHSNVVSIYDFGTEKNQFYLIMEFVEGRNLRQILNRMKRVNQQFSVAQVAHIIKQVAAGLDHAHRCIDPTTGKPLNIIHRDMSPQNVMLGFEGDAKIVDFGIAKAAHQIEATRAGTLKGKFGYMSPEQVEGQAVDSRTDIFALGIMLWEMLANQRLFLANSEINTLRKIRECNVPSLREINPNIPAEMDQIVKKSLEKEKRERYQTAGDMHRDLQGFLSRFDPDFSVQDLSTFVKGLFSEEIIQIRKKQIVYAQVNAQTHHQEKTQVVNDHLSIQNTVSNMSDMSLENISFEKLRKSQGHAFKQTESFAVPLKQAAGDDMDLSSASFDGDNARSSGIQLANKREAHQSTREYKSNTYTDTKNTLDEYDRRNKNATTFTLLFSLSFLLVFFAYINKYHPDFKVRFCKSMEAYQVCPKKWYIPANLIYIDSQPSGAEVFADNQPVGITPMEFKLKQLPTRISMASPGYQKIARVLKSLPENQRLKLVMKKIPTGYLIINSVGVNIYIDGLAVTSGKAYAVPANKDIPVRVINPITGQSKEFTFKVREGKTLKRVLQPPK